MFFQRHYRPNNFGVSPPLVGREEVVRLRQEEVVRRGGSWSTRRWYVGALACAVAGAPLGHAAGRAHAAAAAAAASAAVAGDASDVGIDSEFERLFDALLSTDDPDGATAAGNDGARAVAATPPDPSSWAKESDGNAAQPPGATRPPSTASTGTARRPQVEAQRRRGGGGGLPRRRRGEGAAQAQAQAQAPSGVRRQARCTRWLLVTAVARVRGVRLKRLAVQLTSLPLVLLTFCSFLQFRLL